MASASDIIMTENRVPMWLRLRAIPLHAMHGVYADEKEFGTDFELDVELLVDASAAIKSDNIDDTIDYSKIHDEAIRFSTSRSFNLIEKWVHDLAVELRVRHPAILECIIRVRKPGIAVGGALKWIEVEFDTRTSI